MTNISDARIVPGAMSPEVRRAVAAERLYRAEVALHAAFESGVDAWISAAYDRLHEALAEHQKVA